LVAFDPVILIHRLLGLGVDHLVVDAISGLLVDDVEADALARGGGGVECDRARNERKLQVALPTGTRSHGSPDAVLKWHPDSTMWAETGSRPRPINRLRP